MDIGGTALVTGASRGIGRALALELAHRGFHVIAAMRTPSAGADLPALAASGGPPPAGPSEGGGPGRRGSAGAGGGRESAVGAGRITVVGMDVTDPGSISVPDDLRLLVNNAGLDVDHTPVEHADVGAWRDMFETNVIGTLHMCQAAIPVLRANAPGVIANLTSSSILAPVPFYAGYRGTKAAVSAVCDTLRVELAPFGVRVVEILPGPVDTDMFQVTRGVGPAARHAVYRAMAEAAEEGRRLFADPMVVPAPVAAVAIADALLDDAGPMRYSCDPLGTSLLDMWRQNDDETLHRIVNGDAVPDVVAEADRVVPEGVVQGHVPGHLLTAMGMRRVDDPEAGPTLEMDVRPEATNPHGGLHGGLMAVLIECGAAGVAVRAGDSEMIVAGDMLIRFLSPARVGPARIVGRALRAGRRQIVVQADVVDVGDDRRLVASATLAYARL